MPSVLENPQLRSVVRALRRMPTKRYYDYLRSSKWETTRKGKLVNVGYRCEVCGSHATQVHHKHYGSLGFEEPTELLAVCVRCHHMIHISVWDPANDNKQIDLPLIGGANSK